MMPQIGGDGADHSHGENNPIFSPILKAGVSHNQGHDGINFLKSLLNITRQSAYAFAFRVVSVVVRRS